MQHTNVHMLKSVDNFWNRDNWFQICIQIISSRQTNANFGMFDRNMQLTKRPDALVYRCSVMSSNYSIRIMRLLINHLRLTNYMFKNHTNARWRKKSKYAHDPV